MCSSDLFVKPVKEQSREQIRNPNSTKKIVAKLVLGLAGEYPAVVKEIHNESELASERLLK